MVSRLIGWQVIQDRRGKVLADLVVLYSSYVWGGPIECFPSSPQKKAREKYLLCPLVSFFFLLQSVLAPACLGQRQPTFFRSNTCVCVHGLCLVRPSRCRQNKQTKKGGTRAKRGPKDPDRKFQNAVTVTPDAHFMRHLII